MSLLGKYVKLLQMFVTENQNSKEKKGFCDLSSCVSTTSKTSMAIEPYLQ